MDIPFEEMSTSGSSLDSIPGCLHHTPVKGMAGQLRFMDIVHLVSTATHVKFNYDLNARIEFQESAFYVHRADSPAFTFNEDAAGEAILEGRRLSMPDAQGFICVFELG